jgi:hypothetical protein
LKPGFQLVANPLNNTSANGNTVSNLFPNVPDGTVIYKFDGSLQSFGVNGKDFGSFANDNQVLAPGEGAFLLLPQGGNVSVTVVGDVKQGPLTTTVFKGFTIVASQVPQAGKMQTDLKYTPEDGDTVYSFDVANQRYITQSYDFGAWSIEPTLQVGEAVFLLSPSAKSWTRTFDPNAP